MSMYMIINVLSDNDIHDILEYPIRYDFIGLNDQDKKILFEDMFSEEVHDEELESAILHWNSETVNGYNYHLEGAFQSMHFLLTGKPGMEDTVYPSNFLLKPMHPAGEVGWGPASLFFSAEIREISSFLDKLNPGDLQERYHPETFQELRIYPLNYAWGPEDGKDLVSKFEQLKTFIAQVAKDNQGICITIR